MRVWKLALLAAVMEAFFVALSRQVDLAARLPEAIRLLLYQSPVYLISVHLALKESSSDRRGEGQAKAILAAAALFRLTLFPLYPTLTDDLHRYRWEGKLQAAGGNPYQARPADPEWAHLRDAAYPRVVGKDFKAVYGPLTQWVEHGTYRLASWITRDAERQVFWFKLPYALCDLGVLFALRSLLRARRLPPARILVYAWCPLPVVAFWASGHNDSLMLLALTLALAAHAKGRSRWTFFWLSLAAAAKLWPAMLFPLFVGRSTHRLRTAAIALPVWGVLAAPYASGVWENLRFASGFLGGWRNNDSLYGVLLWALGGVYRAKYAAFGLLAAVILVAWRRDWGPERGSLVSIAAMLMLSANCHPWYLTWLLPWLTLTPVAALLAWCLLAPIAYQPVIAWTALGEWEGVSPLRWLVHGPMYALLAAGWAARRISPGGGRY